MVVGEAISLPIYIKQKSIFFGRIISAPTVCCHFCCRDCRGCRRVVGEAISLPTYIKQKSILFERIISAPTFVVIFVVGGCRRVVGEAISLPFASNPIKTIFKASMLAPDLCDAKNGML